MTNNKNLSTTSKKASTGPQLGGRNNGSRIPVVAVDYVLKIMPSAAAKPLVSPQNFFLRIWTG